MSFFSSILEKLGIGKHAVPSADASTQTPAAPAPGASPTTTVTNQPSAAPITQVDVAQKLEAMAASHGETLNWRTSIVDLLKLLGLDSSLTARKELAQELNYTGSADDSAAMNTWLHSAVMKKLAENGGTVPAEFLD